MYQAPTIKALFGDPWACGNIHFAFLSSFPKTSDAYWNPKVNASSEKASNPAWPAAGVPFSVNLNDVLHGSHSRTVGGFVPSLSLCDLGVMICKATLNDCVDRQKTVEYDKGRRVPSPPFECWKIKKNVWWRKGKQSTFGKINFLRTYQPKQGWLTD